MSGNEKIVVMDVYVFDFMPLLLSPATTFIFTFVSKPLLQQNYLKGRYCGFLVKTRDGWRIRLSNFLPSHKSNLDLSNVHH